MQTRRRLAGGYCRRRTRGAAAIQQQHACGSEAVTQNAGSMPYDKNSQPSVVWAFSEHRGIPYAAARIYQCLVQPMHRQHDPVRLPSCCWCESRLVLLVLARNAASKTPNPFQRQKLLPPHLRHIIQIDAQLIPGVGPDDIVCSQLLGHLHNTKDRQRCNGCVVAII